MSYVHLPILATLRSIKIAIFGKFLKQNVAKNGKNVTQFVYRDRVTILLPI